MLKKRSGEFASPAGVADEATPLQLNQALPEDNVGKKMPNAPEQQMSDSSEDSDYAFYGEEYEEPVGAESYYYQELKPNDKREMLMADRLSVRLLSAQDDSLEEDQILEEALRLSEPASKHDVEYLSPNIRRSGRLSGSFQKSGRFRSMLDLALEEQEKAKSKIQWMGVVALLLIVSVVIGIGISARLVIVTHPPLQPVGPYRLIERQEGQSFFDAYTFYVGKDSVGSNGFNMYVDQTSAQGMGIINMTMEQDELDVFYRDRKGTTTTSENVSTSKVQARVKEPFVYIGSSPSEAGPRNSIRLEGNRRFDRGLFIIDVRHMPAGCGVWPAFWLVDEPNWPINGEIDIIEGVNYQTEAKTALHSTRGCSMDDIPLGTMTGTWDTAQGIPDKKTGIPDMTLRYAQDCFVYNPHQWLNQGCVAVDRKGGTIGVPFNAKGGGVYVLEWDPINRHMKSWVFTPHSTVPENLVQAIRTASKPNPEDRVMPDPMEWPIPYAYFAIGRGTNCEASHFSHMHLVINTAFCGSVAGNRYYIDCTKEQISEFPTCRDYVKSNPLEIQEEAYWKIRGVYVYEREWERTWMT